MDHYAALEAYIKATNTHDFEQVKKVLHDKAVFWFTDEKCTHIDQIQRYFENAWEQIKDEVYSAEDVQWLAVDKHLATCIYTYRYEGYQNGHFVSGKGRATNVFIKVNEDEWKLLHEHLSAMT